MTENESCPAMGTMGIHSDSYYDGLTCAWCGAKKQEDENDEDEENDG